MNLQQQIPSSAQLFNRPNHLGLFYVLLSTTRLSIYLTLLNKFYCKSLNIKHLRKTNTNFQLNTGMITLNTLPNNLI